MDVIAIERDFTAWVAYKLNLTVDVDCFRGGIPDGVEQGVGVLFGSEEKAPGFYGFRPRTWNVQVLAKFDDRDAAMVLQTCLNALVPHTGFTYGSTRFMSLVQRGTSEPFIADDNGKEKTFVSFNMVVTVLTSGRQV